jgi:hypothetical protein
LVPQFSKPMALKVPRQLEHAVHPTLCYLYAYLHTGVFEHDENFERIIAKVPDGLRYVNQAQLAKCTGTQLRDICVQAGIKPVPSEQTELIPAIIAFRDEAGKRRRHNPAAPKAAAPAAAPTTLDMATTAAAPAAARRRAPPPAPPPAPPLAPSRAAAAKRAVQAKNTEVPTL